MRQLRSIEADAKLFLFAAAFPPSPGRLVPPSRRPPVAPFARPASTSVPRLSAGSPAPPVSVMARSTRLLVSWTRLSGLPKIVRSANRPLQNRCRRRWLVSLSPQRAATRGSRWLTADAVDSQVRYRQAPFHSQRPSDHQQWPEARSRGLGMPSPPPATSRAC